MTATIYNQLPLLQSRLSFQPLMGLWKEASDGHQGAAAQLCAGLYQRFSAVPELLQPIIGDAVVKQHQALIEEAMLTLFPAGFSKKEELFAVAKPFSSEVIYASSFFRQTYLDENGNYKLPLDPQVAKNVAVAKVNLAYKLILKKWYGIDLIGGHAFICSYPEREQNIHNYFELEWDPQFIEISTAMDLPLLADDFFFRCNHVHDLGNFPELASLLPLDQFLFEGLVITRIREVSERETVSNIREILQNENSLERESSLQELQQQIRYLLRRQEAIIGFTAFYETDDAVELPMVNFASIVLQNVRESQEGIRLCRHLAATLRERPNFFWQLRPAEDGPGDKPANRIEAKLAKDGWRSALLTALYHDKKIIGCLEIVTCDGKPVNKNTLVRIEHIRDVLQTAMQQYRQQVQSRINRLVKEHFTAVQSSVEWKFNNAAIQYLLQQHRGQTARMAPVVFEQVFPLYGAIDIKNSSGERNKAVQKDLLQQLKWLKNMLCEAGQGQNIPQLSDVLYRIERYQSVTPGFLSAADEQMLQQFMRTDVTAVLQQIGGTKPSFQHQVEEYFKAINDPLHELNSHRRQFEESVTAVNGSIAQYLDEEQERMQKMFPHYFERFVTDGVDFNLYIGQAIVPGKTFQAAYLHNLRLWQLRFLAQAAKMVHRLGASLPLALQTTQLILVYSEPISIRFRNAERKFDIDGVHHARYEVVKKRIDKALVKGTNERLTRPGNIAIVYSHDDEAREYQEYIERLCTEGLLSNAVEMLDVEELQSVSGLKALRVPVQLDEVKSDAGQQKMAAVGE